MRPPVEGGDSTRSVDRMNGRTCCARNFSCICRCRSCSSPSSSASPSGPAAAAAAATAAGMAVVDIWSVSARRQAWGGVLARACLCVIVIGFGDS